MCKPLHQPHGPCVHAGPDVVLNMPFVSFYLASYEYNQVMWLESTDGNHGNRNGDPFWILRPFTTPAQQFTIEPAGNGWHRVSPCVDTAACATPLETLSCEVGAAGAS